MQVWYADIARTVQNMGHQVMKPVKQMGSALQLSLTGKDVSVLTKSKYIWCIYYNISSIIRLL